MKPIITSSLRIVARDDRFLDNKVGSRGEVFYDALENTLRVYNGDDKGGNTLARTDLTNVPNQVFANKVLATVDLGSVAVDDMPPVNPQPGNFWLNSKSGTIYVYFVSQWIQFTPYFNSSGPGDLQFPASPNLNDTFSSGNFTWKWNGVTWNLEQDLNSTFGTLTVNTQLNINGTVSGLSLTDNSDVAFNNLATGQFLVYNGISSKWENASSTFQGGTITNPLIINNSTPTTNASSGALRVTGGVGIGDDLFVGGTITVEDESLDLRNSAEIKFYNTANTRFVGFSAPDSIPADRIWILPSADGTAGQFLRTNGAGVLSWASASGAGGGTPPGGNDTQVQFNDNGIFEGDDNFTYNVGDQLVTVPKLTATGKIDVQSTTASTNTTTGSVTTAGGVGIAGQLNVGGAVNKFTGNTASTSTITGTIVVTGGMGVSGAINAGSTVSSNTEPTTAQHLTTKKYVDANILAFSVAFGA